MIGEEIMIKYFYGMGGEPTPLFKIGDVVIASDGRTGFIQSICTCDACARRGFYEPRVTMLTGVNQIWITDTDKENGFLSFYRIGDKVFGNLEEEQVHRDIVSCDELLNTVKEERRQLDAQLKVVKELKGK